MSVVPVLPIGENRLRIAIDQQIKKYGMDHLTSRKIRENLKAEFNIDFTNHKVAIDRITMDVVEHGVGAVEEGKKSSSADSDSDCDIVNSKPVRKKSEKTRKRHAASDSDSELLEVGQRRRRAAPAPKRTGQRAKKQTAPDKKRRKNGFTAYCALSDELAGIVGQPYCARYSVVKTMWAYFRNNNLMDPKDKRYVLADDVLFKIFKKRRFLAFGMMKELRDHIRMPKELYEAEREALEKFAEEEEARKAAENDEKDEKSPKRDSDGAEAKNEKDDDNTYDGGSQRRDDSEEASDSSD